MDDPHGVCTCMCNPCAEFAGCAACPDCAAGCETCGYPYPVIDLATGEAVPESEVSGGGAPRPITRQATTDDRGRFAAKPAPDHDIERRP